jgi:hypothetical protein
MNNIVRARGSMPTVGQRDGNWIWNGSNWICDPDCDGDNGFPPFGPPVFSGPTNQPPWYPGANGGVSFGAVAPPNPVRGHLWWNGVTFSLFDGATWVPIGGSGAGGGTATGSTPPASPFPGQMWFNGSVLFVWDGTAWVPTSTTRSFVQATAPPAPNPGDLWFDGTQQRIWSGSAWLLVGPGATVGPVPTTTKVFSLTPVSPVVLGANNIFTIMPFTATPSIDTEGGWNATQHKYQPTTPGNYLFFIQQFYGTSQTAAGHALIKNDNGTFVQNSQEWVASSGFAGPANQAVQLASSGMTHCNGSTDFLRLWGISNDGNIYSQSTTFPMMVGWLLP